jgi:hypothetical protein
MPPALALRTAIRAMSGLIRVSATEPIRASDSAIARASRQPGARSAHLMSAGVFPVRPTADSSQTRVRAARTRTTRARAIRSRGAQSMPTRVAVIRVRAARRRATRARAIGVPAARVLAAWTRITCARAIRDWTPVRDGPPRALRPTPSRDVRAGTARRRRPIPAGTTRQTLAPPRVIPAREDEVRGPSRGPTQAAGRGLVRRAGAVPGAPVMPTRALRPDRTSPAFPEPKLGSPGTTPGPPGQTVGRRPLSASAVPVVQMTTAWLRTARGK